VPPLKLTTVPAALSLLAGANAAVLTLAAPAVAVDCRPINESIRYDISVTGGTPKTVGVIRGKWDEVRPCLVDTRPSSPSPWWGSNTLAKDYAQAYAAVVKVDGGADWLYPNVDSDFPTSGPKQVGPLAAWQVNGSGKVQAWAVQSVGNGNGNGGGPSGLNGNEFVVDPTTDYYWLIDPLGDADPVPAPLPLLGGMMALLWSRRLRHRIARGQRAAG
jgi:hypothetical protein